MKYILLITFLLGCGTDDQQYLQERADSLEEYLYERGGRSIKDGDQARDGTDGRDGQDGAAGDPGRNGKDGDDGRDGRDGMAGSDGRDGIDGADGNDGRNGVDGEDGKTPKLCRRGYYWNKRKGKCKRRR